MRSRFTAFVRGDFDHIANTYAKDMRDRFKPSAAESMANSVRWISLAISDTNGGGEDDDTGMVEFSARFKEGGKLKLHHERSNFRREEGRWVYVDGITNPEGRPRRLEKVGRNEACPCGSGRKYKKCCGA